MTPRFAAPTGSVVPGGSAQPIGGYSRLRRPVTVTAMRIQKLRYVAFWWRSVLLRWRLVGVALLVTTAVAAGLGVGLSGGSAEQHVAGPVPLRSAPAQAPVPPSPTPALAPDDPVNAYLPRIPEFGPVPAPEPIGPLVGPGVWVSRIPTQQPVAFITIDDGWTKHPMAASLFKAAKVPVTLFLSVNALHDNPAYFQTLQANGAVIEAHTLTHPSLRGRGRAFQQHEICGSADRLGEWYGRRPVLFRPPFGEKDATTLEVTRECGMKAAFFWTETVDKGIVRYQVGNQVRPGDILLMHFRPAFPEDFIAALTAIHAAGLTPALLEDYLV